MEIALKVQGWGLGKLAEKKLLRDLHTIQEKFLRTL